MNVQVGDLVEVKRRKLPSRIGRVVRLSSKVYVYLGGKNRRGKRYATESVTVLLRTQIKVEER